MAENSLVSLFVTDFSKIYTVNSVLITLKKMKDKVAASPLVWFGFFFLCTVSLMSGSHVLQTLECSMQRRPEELVLAGPHTPAILTSDFFLATFHE